MIQVWIINESCFYIETTVKMQEELTSFDITTPLHTDFLCVKPKWDRINQQWIEGATHQEIDEWIANQPKPSEDKNTNLSSEQMQDTLFYLMKINGIELR